MPQKALMLALAHALSLDPRKGFADDLERWVWTAYFTQSYAQGANTQAVSDALALTEWNKTPLAKPTTTEAGKPTDVAAFERDKSTAAAVLRDSRRRNTTFLRGLMALLVQKDARDWKKTPKEHLLKTHVGAFDFHHIFPEDYLRNRGVLVDIVLNFTPLKSGTNRSIGKDAPSTLFGRNDISFDAMPSHGVELDQLRNDDWDDFQESRPQALMDLIETVVPSVS